MDGHGTWWPERDGSVSFKHDHEPSCFGWEAFVWTLRPRELDILFKNMPFWTITLAQWFLKKREREREIDHLTSPFLWKSHQSRSCWDGFSLIHTHHALWRERGQPRRGPSLSGHCCPNTHPAALTWRGWNCLSDRHRENRDTPHLGDRGNASSLQGRGGPAYESWALKKQPPQISPRHRSPHYWVSFFLENGDGR